MLAFLALAHMDDAGPFIALRPCRSQFDPVRVLGLLGHRLLGLGWDGWVMLTLSLLVLAHLVSATNTLFIARLQPS